LDTKSSATLKLELPEGTLTVTGTEGFIAAIRRAIGPVVSGMPGIPLPEPPVTPRAPEVSKRTNGDTALRDIRSLREEKKPRSAVEMAAIVAHYLADLAPAGERRDTIGTAEITRYFGQAGYRSQSDPRFVLSNAKAAGYFDSAGRGAYKLNPVGYNLVTAGLPRRGSD